MGIVPAIIALAVVGAAGVGVSASSAHQGRKAQRSALHAADMKQQEEARKLTEAEAESQRVAQDKLKKKKAGMSRSDTQATGGLGVTEQANVARKGLLGQ